ncbi:MAG: archease [Methanobacteriaceae archaeon]
MINKGKNMTNNKNTVNDTSNDTVNNENLAKNDILTKYKYFEVTADIGFYSYGKTIPQAFENAGLAMFNVISKTSEVDNVEKRLIELKSEDYVSLLYDYLEELLFLHETEFLLFSKFNVAIEKISTGFKLNAELYGEIINWDKHSRKSEVKAVTFHKMAVNKIDESLLTNEIESCFKLQVILDL